MSRKEPQPIPPGKVKPEPPPAPLPKKPEPPPNCEVRDGCLYPSPVTEPPPRIVAQCTHCTGRKTIGLLWWKRICPCCDGAGWVPHAPKRDPSTPPPGLTGAAYWNWTVGRKLEKHRQQIDRLEKRVEELESQEDDTHAH